MNKHPIELEKVTRVMILLKPDNYTAMNTRKRIIQLGHMDPTKELNLIKLAFTIPRHSKSSVAWYHRQWILTQFKSAIDVKQELELCQWTCTAYPRNYYAWRHRTFLLRHFCSLIDLSKEYRDVCHWIELHISDYSGFHYLQHIIQQLAFDQEQMKQHMQWLDGLIIKFPGHESLWCHKRFCSHLFIKSTSYCYAQHQFVQDVLSNQHQAEALDDHSDHFQAQREYALRFGLWQTRMEKQHYGQPLSPSLLEEYLLVAPTTDFLA